jgi:hypothetical protein
MLSKIIVAGTLLAALGSFKPSEIADSVGWQTLRKSAVIAFSLPRQGA